MSKFGVVALSETLYHELRLMGAKIGVSVLCPGQVRTRIVEPERNRPPELRNDPEWEQKILSLPHVKAIRKMSIEGAKTAMDPKQVADMVFDAIREDKFYIITHPEFMMGAWMRADDLLHLRQPSSMISQLLQAWGD